MYRTEDQLKEGRRFKQLLTKRWYKPGRGGKAAKLEKEALWEEKESKRRGRKAQKEKGGAGMTSGKVGEAGITPGKAGGEAKEKVEKTKEGQRWWKGWCLFPSHQNRPSEKNYRGLKTP